MKAIDKRNQGNIEVGSTVVCINQGDNDAFLTLNKEYIVKAYDENYGLVCVCDDRNHLKYYCAELFVLKEEGEDNMKEENKKEEMVSHPSHYTFGKYEPIDVIEDWKLGFSLGCAVKYIARAGHKWDAIEDLKKAVFYIEYAIKMMEEEKKEKEEE